MSRIRVSSTDAALTITTLLKRIVMAANNSIVPILSVKWISRFWLKVDKKSPNECWLWKNGTKNGYGLTSLDGRQLYAHRIAKFLETGEWTELYTCHDCDTPLCCNPKHLFIGTSNDNNQDKIKKGRQPKGETHYLRRCPEKIRRGEQSGYVKLTEIKVKEIRGLYVAGWLQRDIAVKYGLSQQTVSDIILQRIWRHVE